MIKKIMSTIVATTVLASSVIPAQAATPIIRMDTAVVTDYSDFDIVYLTSDGNEWIYTVFPHYERLRDTHHEYKIAFYTRGTANVEDDEILYIYPR